MKIKLKILLIVFIFFKTINNPILAQNNSLVDPGKLNHIKQLISLTSARNLHSEILNQIIALMKYRYPQVPQLFWDKTTGELSADQLIKKLIPIYQKYFTDEEIIQLIAFYQTPLGKKVVNVNPLIARDSLVVSQQYSQEVIQLIMQELKAENYIN